MKSNSKITCPKCKDKIEDNRNACRCGYLLIDRENGCTRIRYLGTEAPIVEKEPVHIS